MGLLLLFLICAKDNGLLHFRMRWLHCVYVCVFSFAHDTCLRDVPGNSAKRE
jgi:hypothetical protein